MIFFVAITLVMAFSAIYLGREFWLNVRSPRGTEGTAPRRLRAAGSHSKNPSDHHVAVVARRRRRTFVPRYRATGHRLVLR